MAAFLGGPHVDELHPVRFARERLPVALQLGVAGHVVVVADVEAQRFLWRRDLVAGLRRAGESERRNESQNQERAPTGKERHSRRFYALPGLSGSWPSALSSRLPVPAEH